MLLNKTFHERKQIKMLALYSWILLFTISKVLGKNDLKLPLCPTNIEYFPQELPMHCRMPRNAENNMFKLPDSADSDKIDKHQMKRKATLPPEYAVYQSPSPDKLPVPISFPVQPFPMPQIGMPGAPPPGMDIRMLGMPGPNPGIPGPVSGPIPGMPNAIPMPMPIQISGGPPHKMPVIVMPFYSQDRKSFTRPPRRPKRKRKPHRHDSFDTDLNSGEFEGNESSEEGWWKVPKKNKNKRKKAHKKHGVYRRFNINYKMKQQNKKSLLTPILQYVTKDGYVIFEKKISNDEAKNWLGPKDGAIANKEIKVNEEIRKEHPEKTSYKNVEISEELDPKTEVEEFDKDNVEDIDTGETTTVNKLKKDVDSRESNEINEYKKTVKPRKNIKSKPYRQ